jgi:hypothetical protein
LLLLADAGVPEKSRPVAQASFVAVEFLTSTAQMPTKVPLVIESVTVFAPPEPRVPDAMT